jgi:hypothetical protein
MTFSRRSAPNKFAHPMGPRAPAQRRSVLLAYSAARPISTVRPAGQPAGRFATCGASVLAMCCVLLCTSCDPAEPTPTAQFAAPAGMALGGSHFDRIFVANSGSDALQVVQLNASMRRIDMVVAPARYFPLSIPAGPHPTAVAASASGRYIFVLDAVGAAVRVVDADSLLQLRDSSGVPLSLSLPAASGPVAMVAQTQACSSSDPAQNCLGRVFVALREVGSIVALDLLQPAGGTPRLAVQQTLPLPGGAPVALALHPQGDVLFATDAAQAVLYRFTLGPTPSAPEIFPLDPQLGAADQGTGGPLALGGDATTLAIGRPLLRDVVLLANPGHTDVRSGPLAPLRTDPLFTPALSCLSPCAGLAAQFCAGAHPADRALCGASSSPAPLGAGELSAYGAVYVGGVPAQIVALGTPSQPASIASPCSPATPPSTDAYAVAHLDGSVAFIGVRQGAGTLDPQYLPTLAQACEKPSLSYPGDDDSRAPQHYLADCPAHPAGRRFACLGAGENSTSQQVLRLRGPLGRRAFVLQWEGVVPGSEQGAGRIEDAGTFLVPGGAAFLSSLPTVPAVQPRQPTSPSAGPSTTPGTGAGAGPSTAPGTGQSTALSPYAGDILELITSKLLPPCDAVAACNTERHIVRVEAVGDDARLTLDPPLAASCFNDRSVGFRLRVGKAFLVQSGAFGQPLEQPVRLRLGELYGLRTAAQVGQGVLFATQGLPYAAQANACEAYDDAGEVRSTYLAQQSPLLSRRRPLRFDVIDPFTPSQRGTVRDASTGAITSAGTLPGGMVVAHPGRPLVVLSYSGSDALLVLDPADLAAANYDDVLNKILR